MTNLIHRQNHKQRPQVKTIALILLKILVAIPIALIVFPVLLLPAIANAGFNTLADLAGSEYGLYNKVNFFRGLLDTFGIVYQQLWDVDFRKQATRLEVPVYVLIDRHDVNAPTKLTEEYFTLLTAPHKELIWFERSGHNPWMNETEKFVDVMVNKILSPQ